jgi:L-fucose mutarotase
MLKGIDPLLGPELLAHLRAMGHGDEVVVADANFPSASIARRLIRADGISAVQMLRAILSVLPLDEFVPSAVSVMQIVGSADAFAPITEEFRDIVSTQSGPQFSSFVGLERFAFYDRARQAYAVVATGERRIYGNVILRKGIVRV